MLPQILLCFNGESINLVRHFVCNLCLQESSNESITRNFVSLFWEALTNRPERAPVSLVLPVSHCLHKGLISTNCCIFSASGNTELLLSMLQRLLG